MATRAEIEEAIRNADAAGRSADVQALAAHLAALPPEDADIPAPDVDPNVAKLQSTLSLLSQGIKQPPAVQADVANAQTEQRDQYVKDTYNNAPTSARLPVMVLDALSNATDLFGARDM